MDCISRYHQRRFAAVAVLTCVRRADAVRVAVEGPACYDHITTEMRYWPDRWDVTPLANSDEAAEQAGAAEQAIEQAVAFRSGTGGPLVAASPPREYAAPIDNDRSSEEDTMATETATETETKTRGARSPKFPVGTSLTATYKGKTFTADVKETADGERTFVITRGGHADGGEAVKAGEEFTSTSGAGKKITGHAVNGYVFWKVDGAEGAQSEDVDAAEPEQTES